MKQYTAAGGVGIAFAFNLTFLPEFLFYATANALTSLKVEDQGSGVILDLDSAGCTAVKNYMVHGTVPANGHTFRLADGVIIGRNITVSGVTSAAGAVDFFCNGDNRGIAPFKYSKFAILANNPTEVKKFTALFIPSLAAGDRVIVDFTDGHTQIFEREELAALSSLYQLTSGYIINNVNSYIDRVTITCAAANTGYIMSVMLP